MRRAPTATTSPWCRNPRPRGPSTPLAVDPSHPFPYISGLSLNLAVVVRNPVTGTELFARVKVPPLLPRLVHVDGQRFIPLEAVMAQHLDQLFPGMEVVSAHPFRVTRNDATGRFRDGEFIATHTFFRDISDRKEAEALTEQYQRQLEQEVAERTSALVQSEKLATLGRLSAGMAHELNNPAAAAQRGAVQLREALSQTYRRFFDLASRGITVDDVDRLSALIDRGALQATVPDTLDPLSRSDREAAIEDWLDARGVDRAWELAGPILSLNLEIGDLDALAGEIDAEALSSVVSLMTHSYTAFALLAQVGHGSEQISEIVKALKDYSFMDQAPVQEIDLHEGLNNTLIMLQAKLKRGIEVERNYGEDVPRIDALGSELNQVWTNLIDNAADAMGGSGHLMITTSADDGWVVVEIEDDGPGIADDLIDKVFEPFLTTKGPGKGTGLGLNIVFNIIRGSGGHIDVRSKPGSTVFRVRLPVRREAR